MNNKGFTLIEILAVIVLLGVVLTIGGFSVSSYLKNSNEQSLYVFKENIKSGMINCYNECKYMSTNVCNGVNINNNTLTITIGDLARLGFIQNQGSNEDGDTLIINNPINEEENLTNCKVSISYNKSDEKFEDVNFESDGCGTLKNN